MIAAILEMKERGDNTLDGGVLNNMVSLLCDHLGGSVRCHT